MKMLMLFFTMFFATALMAGEYDGYDYEPVQGPPGMQGVPGMNGTDGLEGAIGPRGYSGSNAFVNPNDYQAMGAMAIAGANVHFNPDNDRMQIGIGAGYVEGVSAGVISVAKKMRFLGDPLLSASAATNNRGGNGAGAGLTFSF
ncbi:hypothetical protein GOV07_03245 [Candidatus Woesearchaeota archaeon]|nr:hypothetical protein [Candidatus Woesearchaeota archaeon]